MPPQSAYWQQSAARRGGAAARLVLTGVLACAGMTTMRILRRAACLALAASLAACAGSQTLYPQPYIAKGNPVAAAPADLAAFKARRLQTPPRSDVQDLAESYIAQQVPHVSSVKFQNEFESIGNSVAVCGLVRYRNKYGQMTAWRPFFVEFTRKASKGTEAPYTYDPENELVKLCGLMATNPGG
jgi:hypothetical protein